MIKMIPDLPEKVLGFAAYGKVTGEDYESTLMPAVEAAFRKHDKIRLLYHLGAEFTGFDAAAMWDDAKVGLKHWAAWERCAVVTDHDWLRHMTKAFGFVMPGEVRVFSNAEMSAARAWLSE